jgi:23S rRNA (adenine-N6)-dimethyltransferase
VSSIPYAVSRALLRRLLTPQWSNLRRAALVVEWGVAKRVTAAAPRSRELAWWAARFELELIARVPASSFRPAPAVDSAHLSTRRTPGIGPRTERALWTLLGTAYDTGDMPVRAALAGAHGGRLARRALLACGIDPSLPARSIPAREWSALARLLVTDSSLHWPRLPSKLTDGAVSKRARPRGR